MMTTRVPRATGVDSPPLDRATARVREGCLKIYLIAPRNPESFWTFDRVLPSLNKRCIYPNLSLPTVAGLTPREHDIILCDENVEPIDFETDADIVGLTGYVIHKKRMFEIIAEFRRRGRFVVVGGPFASLCPEELEPAPIELAELRVAVPVGMLLEVLEVEQLQGHAGFPALGVQVDAVRLGPVPRPRGFGAPVQAGFEHVVGERLDLGPVQPRGPGPEHGAPDGATADPQAAGHLPVAPTQGPLQAKNLARLPHGQSLGRHASLSGRLAPPTAHTSLPPAHPPGAGCPIRRVITMDRSG